jgi:hypothetical protein
MLQTGSTQQHVSACWQMGHVRVASFVHGDVKQTLVCLQCGVWVLQLMCLNLSSLASHAVPATSVIPHASTDTVLMARKHC